MQVTLLSRAYRVRVAPSPIVHEGKSRNALVDHRGRKIMLSPLLPPADRLRELLHECRHVWQQAIAQRPDDDESDAKDFALCSEAIFQQIESQGGTPALAALEPEGLIATDSGSSGWKHGDRKTCPCGVDIMCGSIHHTEPYTLEASNVRAMLRWFDCESCGGLVAWHEQLDADGQPNGVYISIPQPVYLHGHASNEWRKNNLPVLC